MNPNPLSVNFLIVPSAIRGFLKNCLDDAIGPTIAGCQSSVSWKECTRQRAATQIEDTAIWAQLSVPGGTAVAAAGRGLGNPARKEHTMSGKTFLVIVAVVAIAFICSAVAQQPAPARIPNAVEEQPKAVQLNTLPGRY
jgi:hypothetical protein